MDEYRLYGGSNMTLNTEAETGISLTRDVALENVTRYAGEEISDSQTALSCMQSILWLLGYEQAEADSGAHPEAAEQAANLKAAIENLKKFVLSEIKENTTTGIYTPGEMSLLELSADAGDVMRFAVVGVDGQDLEPTQIDRIKVALFHGETVERSGQRHSTEDMTRLNSIRDTLGALGVTLCERCAGVEKGAGADDDVQRMSVLQGDVTRLADDVNRLEGENATLHQRVKELEAEPETAKGSLKAVDKGDDVDAVTRAAKEKEEVERIEALPPEAAALELIKRAHLNPTVVR